MLTIKPDCPLCARPNSAQLDASCHGCQAREIAQSPAAWRALHGGSLKIGQLIHEFGRWVHTGVTMPDKPVNRILTISAAGTVQGIVEV